jgi:hypothetical protein
VADVARLTRLRRLKVRLWRTAVVVMAVGLVGLSLWIVLSRSSHLAARMRDEAAKAKAGVAVEQARLAAERQALVEAARPVASSLVKPDVPNGARAATSPNSAARTAQRSNATPTGTRLVQVVLSGAAGSKLLIDGDERPWFGVKHELDFGVHRLQVIAPNEQCCVVPEPRVVKVEPGEGEIRVVMAVEFRDAQLQLTGVDGTTLTCGELFPGVLSAPGRRSVRVSRPETHAACTLFPSVDSGKRPRTIDVVLRPGGTFTVSGT